MRKLIVSVALATAALGVAAVPAAAQDYGRHGGWNRGGPTRGQVNELIRDLNRAEARIDRGFGISRREAVSLRREAQQIRFRLNLAARNGIGMREFFDLRARVNRLEARVWMERRDRDNRRF